MPALSLLFRILSICAAIVVVAFYILGGNKLKHTRSLLSEQILINAQLDTDLKQKETLFLETRDQLDAVVMELAGLKRDKRLNESEVQLVNQELEKNRHLLESAQADKLALAEDNERLRRETIHLKAQGFDTANNPQLMTAQIEDQRSAIRKLEAQLTDAQTVINRLFSKSADPATSEPPGPSATQLTRIQRVLPAYQILVLEIGTRQGVRQNAEFELLLGGNSIAKVKAARVTEDLCVVNILTSDESGKKVLQPGAQIEYML